MYRVKDPVFAMAESSFLDGGSRLGDVDVQALTSVSEWRSVAHLLAKFPNVGRYLALYRVGLLAARRNAASRRVHDASGAARLPQPHSQVLHGWSCPDQVGAPQVGGQFAVMPPSITSSLPVTHAASSEAR
jgi:hypothetical protein